MLTDGTWAQREARRHFGVGEPVCHEPENVDLARAQPAGSRRLQGRLPVVDHDVLDVV